MAEIGLCLTLDQFLTTWSILHLGESYAEFAYRETGRVERERGRVGSGEG